MSSEAKCPYCESHLDDELFYDFEDGDSGEIDCDNCGRTFIVRVRRSVSYDIQKVKGNFEI